MSNKQQIKNNGVYVAQYVKGQLTQSFIPLDEVIYKGEQLGSYLGKQEQEIANLKKSIVKLTNILSKQQVATKESFKVVLDELNKGKFL